MKTQIGLPVQLFGNTPKGREVFAAIIVDLKDYPHAETDLMVYNKDGSSFLAQRVRHKDFKKDGENYWDFLEEEKELKAREYKISHEASPKNNLIKQFFCKHSFVAHRLDKGLFEYDADDLYITCQKCGQQYIFKKFFDNSNTQIKS